MSELEDRISSLLADPVQMEKITKLASSLMEGGGLSPQSGEGQQSGEGERQDQTDSALDLKLLGSFSRILRQAKGSEGKGVAMMEAMKPYVTEKRRIKMSKAIRIAQMAKLAELALTEFRGDGDV